MGIDGSIDMTLVKMEGNDIIKDKLSAFAHELTERRLAMESDAQHAIVRVQADALANAMRKASDEQSKLKQRVKILVQNFSISNPDVDTDSCPYVRENEREAGTKNGTSLGKCANESADVRNGNDDNTPKAEEDLDKVIRKIRANVKDAAQELKRSSNECGSWRVDVSRIAVD